MHESLRQFHPVIGKWFEARLGVPTPPQVMGWPVIGELKSALILAPTGSGKTLAAFLAGIDWLVRQLSADEEKYVTGVQILYVSPLKSLANDVQKNLLKPLAEMAEVAAAMRVANWPEIQVAVRTGDTPPKERAAISRKPPHILITTPESLNLMLMSGARGGLGGVRFVIVDEVHALAGSKRGVFLSLLLERLEEERRLAAGVPHVGGGGKDVPRIKGRGAKIAPGVYLPTEPYMEMVRIGLSATARPEERIARWLAGYDQEGKGRPMEIVRSGQRKRLDLQVVCPFPIGVEEENRGERAKEGKENGGVKPGEKPKGTGHWPEVTRAILQMIRGHKSTLVFGNSRQLVERLAARFEEELAKEGTEGSTQRVPVILPHHGSIAKEVRLETEQALKRGELDAVLATSSLELGIDVGDLDLVVQIDSPGNVAAGLQRVGRAGHLEKATAKGRFVVRGSYALPSFGALLPLMYEGVVEETHVPENCLDVLAQQIVAACVVRPWKRGDLFRVFRRAMPFQPLAEKQFDSVVGMLSKRAARVTAQGLRPRISFDRVNDELIMMPGSAQVAMLNGGVIADTGQYPVYLAGATRGRAELRGDPSPREAQQAKWGGHEPATRPGGFVRLGELDEEFVYETKEGDRIILGSQTWRVVRIDDDRVLVEHATPGSSRMPFWRGESAPRSEMLGEAVARFHGAMQRQLQNSEGDVSVAEWLMRVHHFDEQAADNAIIYYRRQLAGGALPHEKQIVVEHFVDRTGEPVIAILCPLGRRMNYTLRLALEGEFSRRRLPAQIVHHDDGIIIRPPVEVGEIPANPLVWLRASGVEEEIVDQLESTALFGLRFRQNAARALMLPRMNLTQRTPLWQQRLRARHLLALVKKERNFPIIVETYRECLRDVLNIPAVTDLLKKLETGELGAQIVRNQEGGSPFAVSLFSQFQQSYLYEADDPLVQANTEPTVDPHILDAILRRREGDEEQAGAAHVERQWEAADEAALERRILGLDYPARTAEELLEKIEAAGAVGIEFSSGELFPWEWVVGGETEGRRMLEELSQKRRLLLAEWGGKKKYRWIAAENIALLMAARGKVALGRWTAGKVVSLALGELPAALLQTELSTEGARRLVIEQAAKRKPVRTKQEIAGEVPWMGREGRQWLEAFEREGILITVSDGRVTWAEYEQQLRALALRRQRRGLGTVDLAALQRHLLHWQHIVPASDAATQTGKTSHGEMSPVDGTEDALDLLMGLGFSLEAWEHEILPARVEGFMPAILDNICRGGHRVWSGDGAGGIAFWPRHLLDQRPSVERPALSPVAAEVEAFLKAQGACFQLDMQGALGMSDLDAACALAELAEAGIVSCDQLESLREVTRVAENVRRASARAEAAPRRHMTHARPPQRPSRLPRQWWRGGVRAGNLGGRWFLLPERGVAQNPLMIAQRAADRVERLLRRTGFACRELAEPIDGTWKETYDVLTRMEWAGTVRRGYFVDGIAGSQFALPGAVVAGHLEAQADASITWLSMIDPANLWARASTRWISDAGIAARVPRVAGSWIALSNGHPVLAAVSWGQRLIPLPAGVEEQNRALASVAALLERLPRNGHPYLAVRYWDQRDILGSPAEEALHAQGFTRDTQGMRLYRHYSSSPV